jgi:hypothetical protein
VNRTSWVSVALLLCAAAAAADDRPKVDVRFVVTAPLYLESDAFKAQRASIESELTQLLLTKAADARAFPFIQWVHDDAAKSRLTATLLQRFTGDDFEVVLQYKATLPDLTLTNEPPEPVIYQFWEPKFIDDPDIVLAAVRDRLTADFTDSTFIAKLHLYFASHIPIAKKVDVRPPRGVVVHVAGGSLNADRDASELRLHFYRITDNLPGDFKLKNPTDWSPNGVICDSVGEFDGQDIANIDLKSLLEKKARNLAVTIKTYVPSGTTGGSLRTDQ